MLQHRRPRFRAARINAKHLRRNPRFDVCRHHPIRRPRLLRPRLQHQAKLQRNHRQPQRMHARRVRRQHRAEYRRLCLIAHHYAAALCAPAFRENVQVEPARQAVQNLAHVGEYEGILAHVGLAHVLGQAGAGRLLVRKVVGRLLPVTHRQRRLFVILARRLHLRDQLRNRNLPQNVAGLLRRPHIAPNNAAIRLAHLSDRLTRDMVLHLIEFERFIRLAPAQYRDFKHGILPREDDGCSNRH